MESIETFYLQSLVLNQASTHLLWELSTIEDSSSSDKSSSEPTQASTPSETPELQQPTLPGFDDALRAIDMGSTGMSALIVDHQLTP